MKFYITTTLPYVNADPHIGFALEIIQADVLARYHAQKGDEVFFNTGTDEHGLKIYRNAVQEGIDPKAYCDRYAAKFSELKEALNLSYNSFIRTTDEHHVKAAQEFWKRCAANGDIYKKKYKVMYCVGCELEKTKSDLVDGRCPIHPKMDLEIIEEENYFFKYSKYQQQLLKLYETNPQFVIPRQRLHEIEQFTKQGLEDFSVSRLKTKMPWGVSVPGDDEHVMYVWFDALVNYISALGWPENEAHFKAYWPGMQVAGKDNLRQQSSMWQAMLLSAGLPHSKEILIHGFITVDGHKMSKSLGNVVDPIEIVRKYGVDAVRYYLLREIPTDNDGDWSEEKFKVRYNADLANGLGNYTARVLTLAKKAGLDLSFIRKSEPVAEIEKLVAERKLHEALSVIWKHISSGDQYINSKKPWEMETGSAEQKEVMEHCVTILDQVAQELAPFLPATSEAILARPTASLFPRL